MTEDEFVGKLLNLKNRNWVLEQLKLQNESNSQSPQSLDSLLICRRILQLREHFNWMVWALAHFYFFYNSSSTHYSQFQNGVNPSHNNSTNDGGAISINSSVTGISSQAIGRPLLPKVGSKVWSDGFEYKGVFVKVMPFEDAKYIRNEIKALRYVQTELLELRTLAKSNNKTQSGLHEEVFLPLIAGVQFGGFYLYATPIIFLPKSPSIEAKLQKEFAHVKEMIRLTSPYQMNYSPSPQPLLEYMDDSSSLKNSPQKSSTLNENLTKDSTFKYMPILKHVSSKNMIPIYDYEQYPQPLLQQNIQPQFQYLLVNLYGCLPNLLFEDASSDSKHLMMRIPSQPNEEITYHKLGNHAAFYQETAPSTSQTSQQQYLIEARELKRFIVNGELPRSHSIINQKLPSVLFMSQKKGVGDINGDADSGDMDIQADEYQNLLSLEEDEENKRAGEGPEDLVGLFQKRTFIKNGWEFTMVCKKNNVPQGATHQPGNMFQMSSLNENKRASNLFNSRELQIRGPQIVQSLQVIKKSVGQDIQEEPMFGSPRKEGLRMQIVQMEEHINGDQTIDYSVSQNVQPPPLLPTSNLSGRFGLFSNLRQDNQANQENVDTSHLASYPQNTANISFQNRILGGVLVTGRLYKKEMKIQYCLTSHHQAGHSNQNIEILINASLDQVVQVLEKSDKIFNKAAYNDLMHRKGLNMRFAWPLLAKLRQNQQRELVMIDILLRVMRKIINEEIKIKSITVSTQVPQQMIVGGGISDPHSYKANEASSEEFYLGGGSGQTDTYKEVIVFFLNTLLKRKMHKYRHIFDEAILGLLLSRSEMLGFISFINLKKEEYNYLESKDILEDILEAPSKNPALFINAISSYFNLEFSKEFLRILRQDKFAFLAKSQPISKSDILKLSCRTTIETYFTLKDEAYFILARQINKSHQSIAKHQLISNNQNSFKGALQSTIQQQSSGNSGAINKIPGKIKTKSDKDRLAISHHVRNHSNTQGNFDLLSMRSSVVQNDQQNVSLSMIESNEIHNNSSRNNEQMSNRARQPILHDFRQPKDSLSTIRQYQNMEAIINESPQFAQDNDQILDFSKISKRNNQFKPSQQSEIVLPSIFYKMKTSSQSNPLYYFDDSSKPYNGETLSIFRPIYEMPNQDVIDEWTIVMESLMKDMSTVNGSDQVLLEAFVYDAIQIYFYKNGDSDELFKVLQKIRDALFFVTYCSPETLVMIQIITGLYFEEKRDQTAIEAEKSYLTAMICFFQLYGDPRGRGNFSVPYNLFLSWKLSLLSLAEDKKVHDSEFAEELFDATLRCLPNHKSVFKEQQLQSAQSANMLFGGMKTVGSGGSSLPTEVMGHAHMMTATEKTQFDVQIDKMEMLKNKFEMKRYQSKPFNVTYASGMYRSNFPNVRKPPQLLQQQAAMNVYVTVNHHYNNNKELKGEIQGGGGQDSLITDQQFPFSNDIFKSRSQIILSHNLQGSKREDGVNINQQMYDLEPSEIDLEIEDENRNFLLEENFSKNEWQIGICPFQHWSIYRQQIMQILQAHNLLRNNPAQTQYQKQIYRDMLQKFLPKDLFYQWLLRYNPLMYQSGVQWNNQLIRDFIFCQPHQQMISSSSSSVVMSNHNMSHHSMISGMSAGGISVPTSTKEKQRQIHLGTYSQILGKEVGGISKHEMHGVLYAMGTDGYGQLGQEAIISQGKETQSINLKVLYPRMVLNLRDEMIKDVCSGHSHVFAINIHGQVFAWGLNESSQLGLGPHAPPTVRKPVFNQYLSNITKMSAGNEHSLALNKQGELYVWGCGGLNGLNDQIQKSVPTKLEFFNSMKIAQAVCGGLHTLVLTKDGEVYSWGSTEGGQLGLPLSMLQDSIAQEIPVLVPTKIPSLQGINVTQIACGEAHSISLTKDGKIYGWGMSNYGQLGLGFSADSFEPGIGMEKSKVHEPTEISGLKNERITKIICGATFTLFQSDKGELFGCGMNDLGQLGLDTYMEELINHKINNQDKGRHNNTSSDVTVPTRVICFQGIELHNIACGENHALAVSGDEKNMLWAWGMYRQGQLGLGEVSMKMNPRPVQNLCSSTIQKLACGGMHSLVLLGDQHQLQTVYQQYYAAPNNFDVLSNHWICDIRQLGQKLVQQNKKNALFNNNEPGSVDDDYDLNQRLSNKNWASQNPPLHNDGRENLRGRDDEVTEDAEGKVKNPK